MLIIIPACAAEDENFSYHLDGSRYLLISPSLFPVVLPSL